MIDYILFVSQLGGFQSRSMLIPANEFLQVRKDDYDLLKKSVTSYTFVIDDKEHIIDNLLLQNTVWSGNLGYPEIHTHTRLCSDLLSYAEGLDDDCYIDLKDKEWYDKAPCNLCRGFNHIKNYLQLKNITEYQNQKINIIDSFLVLNLDDGILKLPPCDTVEEMHQMFYSKK